MRLRRSRRRRRRRHLTRRRRLGRRQRRRPRRRPLGATRLAGPRVKRGPDVAPADVGEDNVRGGVLLDDELGVALGGGAGAVVAGVQPVHVAGGVVPDGEGEDHFWGRLAGWG